MKNIVLILTMSLFALVTTAKSSKGNISAKVVDKLTGSWQLSKVYDGKKEIPTKSQKGIIDHITFTQESMYMSHSNNTEIDSGFYRTNEIDHLLYLETANKLKDNTTDEWSLHVGNDVITLSRREPLELRRFKYVYVKKD